jgi:hypothetical protein
VTITTRIIRPFIALLTVGLLAVLLVPLATRSSQAAQPAAAAPAVTGFKGAVEGQALTGKAAIEATVTGSRIAKVVFQLDGPKSKSYTDRNAPYYFLGDDNGAAKGWDTTGYPDGVYMLTATVTDRSGRRGSAMLHFSVSNRAQPQPTATQPQPTATPPQPTATPDGNTPPVAGQPCPAWVHDRYVTTGPDGNQYPTWHPPIDPQYGCLFGHEHGADPRTSKADSTMPAFGYAAALMGMAEPHAGFKVFIINQGTIFEGKTALAHHRVVFHMGTSGVKRYTERHHSIEYDYVANDGTGREAHVYGMADTGAAVGSTCDRPRQGGRDFSTIGCPDSYEIWTFRFDIIHPDDPFTGVMEVRLHMGGAVAAFDPVTTRDPADNTRLVYTQDYRSPGSGIDPLSPNARYQGCARELYGGPNYWNNAARPTIYYTDVHGHVVAGPGPGVIRQEVSASKSTSNEVFKYRQDFCGNGIHAPN